MNRRQRNLRRIVKAEQRKARRQSDTLRAILARMVVAPATFFRSMSPGQRSAYAEAMRRAFPVVRTADGGLALQVPTDRIAQALIRHRINHIDADDVAHITTTVTLPGVAGHVTCDISLDVNP